MSPNASRQGSVETRAFVLGKVDYAESDQILTLFTEAYGRVAALARGARKSRKRFGGTLEPIHTLSVTLSERLRGELFVLHEARLDRVRHNASMQLAPIEAAGKALGWLKHSAPVETPEPLIFEALVTLMDQLDQGADPTLIPLRLTEFALTLLRVSGFGLDFERCVRCGKACPSGQSAQVDAVRGGLVCRRCGGARLLLSAAQRGRLQLAAVGVENALDLADASIGLELAERALLSHIG